MSNPEPPNLVQHTSLVFAHLLDIVSSSREHRNLAVTSPDIAGALSSSRRSAHVRHPRPSPSTKNRTPSESSTRWTSPPPPPVSNNTTPSSTYEIPPMIAHGFDMVSTSFSHHRIVPELVRPSPELQLTRALSPSSRSSSPSPSSTKAAPDFPKLRRIAPTPSPSSLTTGAAAPPSPESPPSSPSVAAVRCKPEPPPSLDLACTA